MKFLSLTTLITAAALAVPALLLLYFLKLKRQEFKISSTLLWRKAVQDLQVNAPFQKLRKNLLLFLQLLVLAGLLFALGQPVAKFVSQTKRTIVVLVDQSGSMKTREGSGTRIEEVKREAKTFVDNLGSSDKAMVIAFADRARVVCPFTADKRQLARQIESVQPTDGRSTIAEALQLAVAHSSKFVEIPGMTAPQASLAAADIELFSDGRIEDADNQVVQRGSMRYYKVGQATDNVGIVALDARRSYERPEQISVFARVENFGPAPVKTDVTLLLDNKILSVKEISLAAAEASTTQPAGARRNRTGPASAQNLAFELTHDAAGTLELRVNRDDALAADNACYAPLPPPRDVVVLGVGDRPVPQAYLSRVVSAVPGVRLEWMTPQEYEAAGDDKLLEGGRSKFDLVIFDKVDTAKLPPGNYLFFGGVPKVEGVAAEGDVANEHVLTWDETHPLMRYVRFEGILIDKWRRLKLPSQAVRVAEGETSTIIAYLSDPGRQFVLVAFDFLDSNAGLVLPFVMFMQNVVRTLTASAGDAAHMLRPSDTITCAVPRGAATAEITRPDGEVDTVDVANRLQLVYGRTESVGLYQISFDDAAKTRAVYAVNLLDRVESTISPNDRFVVGSDVVSGQEAVERTNQPLWPYAVLAAIGVLLIEWWIYNRRVMI